MKSGCFLHLALRAGVAACLVAAALLAPAQAREGVDVGKSSIFTRVGNADQVEQSAKQQYLQLSQQARSQRHLASENHPQLRRLRAIAQRIIPFSYEWNPRARDWQWEVNLIDSPQINAFCMPGGKIAFYTGILDKLQLSDDEVAVVMGHEMAHALREHARERMGKSALTQGGMRLGGAVVAGLFGIDPRLTDMAARGGANLLTLEFSRENESEADLVGLELAARAGFNPRAGISLWNKMSAANKGAPPQWLSTHPAGKTRIAEMEKNLPKVLPLYERAKKG